MLIGYARVSTDGQNLEPQRAQLREAGCGEIFEEMASGGGGASRPELAAALAVCGEGDCFVVTKLDRLGRSTRNLIEFVEDLGTRGIEFRSLGDSIDTRSAMGRFFFTVMAALAELERDRLRERTVIGLEAAKRQGRNGGRPRKLTDRKVRAAAKRLASGETYSEVAHDFNVSASTLTRRIAEIRDKGGL